MTQGRKGHLPNPQPNSLSEASKTLRSVREDNEGDADEENDENNDGKEISRILSSPSVDDFFPLETGGK